MAFTIELTSSVEPLDDGSGEVIIHIQVYSDSGLVRGLPSALRIAASSIQSVVAQPTLPEKIAAFVETVQTAYPEQFGTQALLDRIAGNTASKAAADAVLMMTPFSPSSFGVFFTIFSAANLMTFIVPIKFICTT